MLYYFLQKTKALIMDQSTLPISCDFVGIILGEVVGGRGWLLVYKFEGKTSRPKVAFGMSRPVTPDTVIN